MNGLCRYVACTNIDTYINNRLIGEYTHVVLLQQYYSIIITFEINGRWIDTQEPTSTFINITIEEGMLYKHTA